MSTLRSIFVTSLEFLFSPEFKPLFLHYFLFVSSRVLIKPKPKLVFLISMTLNDWISWYWPLLLVRGQDNNARLLASPPRSIFEVSCGVFLPQTTIIAHSAIFQLLQPNVTVYLPHHIVQLKTNFIFNSRICQTQFSYITDPLHVTTFTFNLPALSKGSSSTRWTFPKSPETVFHYVHIAALI